MTERSLCGARVLIVDDDEHLCSLLRAVLSTDGADVAICTSATEALDRLANLDVDIVVTDIEMDGMDGLELCTRIVQAHPDVRVCILSGHGNFERAVAAIRAGAFDFIVKPFEPRLLTLSLERALRDRRLSDEVARLRGHLDAVQGFGELRFASPTMERVADRLARVAQSDASVLVTGESGTGKELVARALHRAGPRPNGPFVAINCAAMPETLLESELFGHVRGAFTDARTPRTGLFVQANGGTLFLDEIGDLPLPLQPKLLRAIQDRAVRPIGGDAMIPFDARIVAATNQDLEDAVDRGRFRADLFFRLNVVEINLPPLRRRGNDVLLLAQHFIDQYAARTNTDPARFTPQVAQRLLSYSWPGNVRELQNCMEASLVLARGGTIGVGDLPARIRRAGACDGPHPQGSGELPSLEEVEQRHIRHVLEAVQGSRTLAARVLGLDRKTLYRKLQQYGAR